MRCFVLQNAECGDPNQQDQPNGSDNGMCGYIPFAAERDDGQKVGEDKVIEYGIAQQPVRDDQKRSQGNEDCAVYNAVEFIPLLAFVLGEHTDANHDVGDNNQNGR